MRHLLTLADLENEEVDEIIETAGQWQIDPPAPAATRISCATLFASSSLRTRLGFSVAATRLGWDISAVDELRLDASMSGAESLQDTLRTVSGMVDVAVVRAPVDLVSLVGSAQPVCPIISGGDERHHPTQTLIDISAIRELKGSETSLRIALLGDLTMRAAHSLFDYFARRPPIELRAIAAPGREPRLDDAHISGLGSRLTTGGPLDLDEIDVLYVVGLPPRDGRQHLDDAARTPFKIDRPHLDALPGDAIVLSPLPVVDELTPMCRRDPRLAIWPQSDRGVSVRMAVLHFVVSNT